MEAKWFVYSILLIILAVSVYLSFFNSGDSTTGSVIYQNNSKTLVFDDGISDSIITETPSDPRENLSVWYFGNMPIPYHFSESYPCLDDDKRKERILYALRQITQETKQRVTFYESSSEGIEINCLDDMVGTDKLDKTHAVAGEGGPTEVEGNKILSASIDLYKINPKYEYCKGYPTTEMHEIMHAFGIAHVVGRVSIMNTQRGHGQECTQLDDTIINCLDYIYSNGDENFTCNKIPFLSFE